MTTGLTLGKFAPLHKGHELLIRTALTETDQVIVLVYDAPSVTTVPLPVRAAWIRRLYPKVEVIEGWNGPEDVGLSPEIIQQQNNYLRKTLSGRRITHFYSSEGYGCHVSQVLGAIDRRVDPERREFSISGSAIRSDPYANRRFLSPLVYRDLITRAVFLGAPSTGKTSIARRLAEEWGTTWMPEFGREFWDEHQSGRRLTSDQLVEIAEEHCRREDQLLLEANRFLFVDTDATTTLMFARHYHGDADRRLAELAAETVHRYDLFFLCEDDIPYDDTWDRSGDMARGTFQKQVRADLLARRIPFVSLSGSMEQRLELVNRIISPFDRFRSAADQLLETDADGRAIYPPEV